MDFRGVATEFGRFLGYCERIQLRGFNPENLPKYASGALYPFDTLGYRRIILQAEGIAPVNSEAKSKIFYLIIKRIVACMPCVIISILIKSNYVRTAMQVEQSKKMISRTLHTHRCLKASLGNCILLLLSVIC